jgi:hypothetical protein
MILLPEAGVVSRHRLSSVSFIVILFQGLKSEVVRW